MPECAHRFSPRVPREIDIPKSSQQVCSPLVQRLQPRVFDAPFSSESADNKLAVTPDGDGKRVGPRTDALQQVFQGGDHGAELGLIVRHVVAELDLPGGDGPVRPGNLVAAVAPSGVTKGPAVEDDCVIGAGYRRCRLQGHVPRTCGGRRDRPLPACQRTLQIAHEVDQLLMGERLRVDTQQLIAPSMAPIIVGHA